MTILVAALFAGGLVLLGSGLPLRKDPSLARRVEPYISGLQGRPSRLLVPHATERGVGAWIDARLKRLHVGSADLVVRLQTAGRSGDVSRFRAEQLRWGLGAVVAIVLLAAAGALSGALSRPESVPVLSVIGFASGFLGREWWLGREVERRRAALDDELPIAIDLVTLSIMAGESVPAAFARAGKILHSGIGEELRSVVDDVRAGATTIDALQDMGTRLESPAGHRFVDALVTAIERGAPLAEVLRAQADDHRAARRRRLVEIAGRREVVMLVPVVFLILPVVIVFALFPGVVSLELLVP